MAAQVKPYRELSGDFVDYIEVDHCLYFIQADVSKGVAASLVTAQAIALFKLFARDCLEVTQLAKQMNRELKLSRIALDLTAFIAKLDYESFLTRIPQLRSWWCNHPWIGDTDDPFVSTSKDLLAVLSDAQFHLRRIIDFRNKRLWVVTDGIRSKKPQRSGVGFGRFDCDGQQTISINPPSACASFAFFDKVKTWPTMMRRPDSWWEQCWPIVLKGYESLPQCESGYDSLNVLVDSSRIDHSLI